MAACSRTGCTQYTHLHAHAHTKAGHTHTQTCARSIPILCTDSHRQKVIHSCDKDSSSSLVPPGQKRARGAGAEKRAPAPSAPPRNRRPPNSYTMCNTPQGARDCGPALSCRPFHRLHLKEE